MSSDTSTSINTSSTAVTSLWDRITDFASRNRKTILYSIGATTILITAGGIWYYYQTQETKEEKKRKPRKSKAKQATSTPTEQLGDAAQPSEISSDAAQINGISSTLSILDVCSS